ncbi:hypothetical protein T484DRAFT_1779629, partial [Baffinella frigidus]
VWVLYGDGALGFSIAEIDTLVRSKLGVVCVVGNDAGGRAVGNDAGWAQIVRDQERTLVNRRRSQTVGRDCLACSYGGPHVKSGVSGGRMDADRWTQIVRDQERVLSSSCACTLARTDYHLVAEGFGAKGFLVTALAQIPKALS